MPFPSAADYEALVYSLPDRFARVERSTLVVAPIGRTLAKVEGQVSLRGGLTLDVWELVDFQAGRIRSYSYEIYRAGEKLAWYDPLEQPHIPELASTPPHHQHVQPNIRHNRVPAPGISLERPNLPGLIEAIEQEFLGDEPFITTKSLVNGDDRTP
ncbi:MAG: hypothetical protein HY332_15725 [Chloroflexi bacterium]|nr:hypothetical protein [Chloroflexota bacterium]